MNTDIGGGSENNAAMAADPFVGVEGRRRDEEVTVAGDLNVVAWVAPNQTSSSGPGSTGARRVDAVAIPDAPTVSREDAVARLRGALRLDPRATVDLVALGSLSEDELARTTDRLRRLRAECGCHAGAAVLFAALGASTFLSVRGGLPGGALLLAAEVLAVSVALSIAVKFAVVGVAQFRWRRARARFLAIAPVERAA